MSLNPFASRLQQRVTQFSALCVGIDPSGKLLHDCGLPDDAEGAYAFGERILHASEFDIAIIKPQSAYFERHGSEGVRAMEELTRLAQSKEILVLLDAKRGDIDTTGAAYAEAYFSPQSPLRADALTLHAYLGLSALNQAIDFAVMHGGGLFPVVRSSNPEGQPLQCARLPDGRSVAESLCDEITALNKNYAPEGLGPIGAVVGATCDDADAIAARMPRAFILAPGVGAQGATMRDVRTRMPSASGRVLASVSRAILKNGSQPGEIATAIRALRDEAQRELA
ncbi:MAG TPA: orotidine-5'-phosphate decarboxylase [Burkholderiales bacterium]|nr:orotidine-5'-phosphate decarboxylase [Burkholderiales bacterium]